MKNLNSKIVTVNGDLKESSSKDNLQDDLNPQRQINPLLKSKILKEILWKLPIEELPKLRLISKQWNEESCKRLQKSILVVFRTAADVSRYIELFKRDSKLIESSFLLPHGRFHLSKIRLNLIYDNYMLRKFFRLFALQIKYLQLDFTGSTFRFKFLRMCVLQNLSHLESLVLTFKEFTDFYPWNIEDKEPLLPLNSVSNLTVYGYGRESTLKKVLAKILECLPNLKSIETGEQQGRLLFEILYGNSSTLSKITNPLPYLCHLDLHYLFPDQFDIIVKNGLRLKSLRGELQHFSEEGYHKLKPLLNHLAPTLENLCLDAHWGALPYFPALSTPMNRLQSLELHRFTVDLNILDNFPGLKHLKFHMVNFEWENHNALLKNTNLLTLRIEICKDLQPKLFVAFGQRFPKLRKLDLPFFVLDNRENLLGSIFSEMENLEELSLCQDSTSDEDVTGVQQNFATQFLENLKFGRVKQKDFDAVEKRRSPWIGNLKNLRVLHLKSVKLTDFGVIFGIAHCKRLERLTLHSPYSLTNLTLRAIADNLGENLMSLDLFCSGQITDSAISYLTSKMEGRKCNIAENQYHTLEYSH